MKQMFKFKLEDGTVITGANPVEALMQVKASTTGKAFDEKFKKEKQEKEVSQALAELEKLYDGYIELEKKIKSGAKVEKTPEIIEGIPEEKAEEPELVLTESKEETRGTIVTLNDLPKSNEGEILTKLINNAFKNFKEGDEVEYFSDGKVMKGTYGENGIKRPDGLSDGKLAILNAKGGYIKKIEKVEGNKQNEDAPVATTPVKLFGVKEEIVTTEPEKIKEQEENEGDLKSLSTEKLFELVENEAKKLTNSVSTIYYILSGYDIGGRITKEQNKAVLKMINEKYPDGDKVIPITPDKVQETKQEIEKIIDQSNESKTSRVEKLNQTQLEKEINENIRQLLDKEKDKEPEIKKFKFISTKNGFLIKSTISIKSGEPGDKIRVRKDVDIELPLENKNGYLSLGQEKIESWPITKMVRKKFEPLLPQIIPGIKLYFENKYKQDIKSMKIENGELVIEFE